MEFWGQKQGHDPCLPLRDWFFGETCIYLFIHQILPESLLCAWDRSVKVVERAHRSHEPSL